MVVCAVFKAFPQDRAQQRCLLLWNAFSERNVEQIVGIMVNGFVLFFARSSWCRGRAVLLGV